MLNGLPSPFEQMMARESPAFAWGSSQALARCTKIRVVRTTRTRPSEVTSAATAVQPELSRCMAGSGARCSVRRGARAGEHETCAHTFLHVCVGAQERTFECVGVACLLVCRVLHEPLVHMLAGVLGGGGTCPTPREPEARSCGGTRKHVPPWPSYTAKKAFAEASSLFASSLRTVACASSIPAEETQAAVRRQRYASKRRSMALRCGTAAPSTFGGA